LTAGLAYTAAPVNAWHGLGQEDGAVEKVAVSWAVLRYSATIPASVEDQASVAAATRNVLELAAKFGKTEEDLREVLRNLQFGIPPAGGRDPCALEDIDRLA
jgi:hypothetical protein